MMREIGSEYHYDPLKEESSVPHTIAGVSDYAYTFSGRTAMSVVLQNLTGIKKALLPSYCCDSMIEPFRALNIKFEFYDVFWANGLQINLSIDDDVDLLLWCNYFGFKQRMPDLTRFISRGGIVVEDITHSYFSCNPYNLQSHYLVASVRKWLPLICGGYCASLVGNLNYKPTIEVPSDYEETKVLAMKQKAEYLNCGDKKIKENYLQNYSQSNRWLADHYFGLKIDPQSKKYLTLMDASGLVKRRLKNASAIYECLKIQKNILPMFCESEMDCPLFVPVLFTSKAERDKVRQRLIDEMIYCPIHWPKPDGCCSNLYDLELSLVCDQRYDENDMRRMMQIVCG